MRRPTLLVVTLLAGLALAACGGSGGAADADGPGVDTAFGAVTVPDDPKRVVALGWGDAETALALGVQPVGASDWLEFGGDGVGPWLDGAYDRAPEIIGTNEPELEKIAALRPDLILDVRSSGDEKRHEQLSGIAPTVGVPEGAQDYDITWQEQTAVIAEALGVPEKGRQVTERAEGALAQAAAANPEFAGKTATVAALSSDGWGVYVPRDSRQRLMKALGFAMTPFVTDLDESNFFQRVSPENLDRLDADLVVAIAIGAGSDTILADQVFTQVPAVRAGHLVTFDDRTYSQMFSINTPPSIEFAAEKLPPIFAAKL